MNRKKLLEFELILLDIDGTLINDNKTIDYFTRRELQRTYKDFNVKIALISSRMPESMRKIEDVMGIPVYIAAYNGALIYDIASNSRKELSNYGSLNNIAGEIISIARSKNANWGIFTGNKWFVTEIDYWVLREIRGTLVWPTVGNFEDVLNDHTSEDQIYKVMIRGNEGLIDDIYNILMTDFAKKIKVYKNRPSILEIFSSSVSKGQTVDFFANHLDLPRQKIIAFGDGLNDRSLLIKAGWGVAMGNAKTELKSIADEITLSNNENGVGLILRKYFPSQSPLIFYPQDI